MSALACGSALLGRLERLEDRNRIALAQLDDGLLPLPRATGGLPAALGLGLHRGGADLDHLDIPQLLDGLADLGLVRLVVDAEGVLAGLGEHEGLLGHDRADDDLTGVHYAASSSLAVSDTVRFARATS